MRVMIKAYIQIFLDVYMYRKLFQFKIIMIIIQENNSTIWYVL